MKVAIIDPSCFTMPYDHCLCDALGGLGTSVTFVGSEFTYSDWKLEGKYARYESFYRHTNRLFPIRNNNKTYLRQIVKGIEHCFDMRRFVKWVERSGFDVIHFQWLPIPIVDRWFVSTLHRICPVVLTIHDSKAFHGSVSSLQSWGYHSVFNQFDKLIAHTHFTKKRIINDTLIGDGKISVIPMGVFDYYKTISPINPSSQSRYEKILFFGVLRYYKGLDTLIRALALLPEPVRHQSRLIVAGYPAVSAEIYKGLASSLGVDEYIEWDLRFVPESEVSSYFSTATVVVLPYREIDQSAVLLTALAFAKPVIATNIGGLGEILENGVHGYLVEPDDPKELALALEKILTDKQSRMLMSSAVDKIATQSLSWSSIAEATISVYNEAITLYNN